MRVVLSPAGVAVYPTAIALLTRQEFSSQFPSPMMLLAVTAHDDLLPVDRQRFRHGVVVIVESGVAQVRIVLHGKVPRDPAQSRLGAGILAADVAVEVALQAGVGHAAVGAMRSFGELVGLALAAGRVDEAAVLPRPLLIVAFGAVLAALQKHQRLVPDLRIGGVVGLLQRLQGLLEIGQIRIVLPAAVADAAVLAVISFEAFTFVILALGQELLGLADEGLIAGILRVVQR